MQGPTESDGSPPDSVDPGAPAWLRGFGRGAKWLVVALGAGFAIHILIPLLGDAGKIVETIRGAAPWWLVVAAIASVFTYLFAALGIRAAVATTTSLASVSEAQLASSAAILFAPAGIGGLALNQRFFERSGMPRSDVAAGILLNTVVAFLVHAAGVVVLSVAFGVRLPGAVDASARVVFDVAVVLAVVAGLVVWALPASRRLLRPIVAMLRVVPGILRDRSRLVRVAGAAIGVNVAYAASLQASLAAFGSAPDPAHTMLVYLVAATIGTVTPTPGGIGGTELALVAGLTRIGALQAQAVAAALAFRLVTFWLPVIPGLVALRRLRRRSLL
jgi:undecaprenyl-diphosphatase